MFDLIFYFLKFKLFYSSLIFIYRQLLRKHDTRYNECSVRMKKRHLNLGFKREKTSFRICQEQQSIGIFISKIVLLKEFVLSKLVIILDITHF